jgi:hypothetical protein
MLLCMSRAWCIHSKWRWKKKENGSDLWRRHPRDRRERKRKCVCGERLGFLKESCDRKSGKGRGEDNKDLKLARIDKEKSL